MKRALLLLLLSCGPAPTVCELANDAMFDCGETVSECTGAGPCGARCVLAAEDPCDRGEDFWDCYARCVCEVQGGGCVG